MLEVKKKAPLSRCIYLGDTAQFPYGQKSPEEITACASAAISLMLTLWAPRAIVVACNTISVTSLERLRSHFSVPIVGTVPAIRLAARVTKNKRIGLLATNATVRHPYNARLIKDFASDCTVLSRGDPELIDFVEHRLFCASAQERLCAVKPAVDFFHADFCDTIILGCTHFTHIAEDLSACAGESVRVVDSRDGVANQALRVLDALPLQVPPSRKDTLPADCTFFVTALRSPQDAAEYEALCRRFAIPWGGVVAG